MMSFGNVRLRYQRASRILRSSIEKTAKVAAAEEHRFQETIINTIAEFAKNLPDAQKIEILKFILNFDPLPRYHRFACFSCIYTDPSVLIQTGFRILLLILSLTRPTNTCAAQSTALQCYFLSTACTVFSPPTLH
ncbi:unnamed protein product [Dibothriocephalus latus]|uniref:Uncharacterized protein n=1 Tax=Dibothriocephalus latus TaxID=60516 RepID=A0A3P7LCR7_DIBLA|nr:unnamed protein product [Dibothriocephalus latus]